MTQGITPATADEARASMVSLRSLDTHRRGRRVDLWTLGKRFGRSGSWLSRALKGVFPLTRGQVKELRGLIDELTEAPR